MTDTTMTNGTMTNMGAWQRLKGAFREYFRGWSLPAAAKAGHRDRPVIAALKSVSENSVVPPGLESFLPLFPALKRWAKLGRPSGAAFSCAWFHQTVRKRVLTHTLKRCSTQNQVQHRVFPQSARRSEKP